MIFLGATLITHFRWVLYVFGAFLIYTGINMFREENKDLQPENNPIVRLVTRLVPMTRNYDEEKFFTVIGGRKVGTLLLLVLVIVEVADVVFAVDSIPAIFAITTNTFIVYTSNVFAILGLRSMFFLLNGVIQKFHYLRVGLAIVLTFIGVKMLIVIGHVEIPVAASLAFVVTVLLGSIAASALFPKKLVRATKVRLTGNPPVFILSGSGTLTHMVIYDARQSNDDQDQSCALWEIEPVSGYHKARLLEEIGTINYGEVPEGYRQVCPENGDPPALARGNTYEYWFDTSDAPHARKYFVIRGSKAIEVAD
jgi:predicted tellurium resistance membrane protein TerC